jgi:Flp pilus assembly protein TadD
VQLWFELGLAAAGELEFAQAEGAFRRAWELAPRDSSLLVLLGQQYHKLRRLDLARACFEEAVAVDPGSAHARLSLAAWFERDRRLNDAWECAEAAVATHPNDAQAQTFRALLLHRLGRNEEAERELRKLIARNDLEAGVAASSRHQLGVVLDALGQYDEAMKWLAESKDPARQSANPQPLLQAYDRADRRRRELLAALTPATIRRWREEGPASPCPAQPALLGGHPRSGTTLLEQILGANSAIHAFDEPEAFVQEIWNQLAPMQAATGLTLSGLNVLNANRRAQLRERYVRSLLRESANEAGVRVWLDKNPSPTASLHLWLRIFPELKVVIALRDPRDVVLSCYFQNLMLTPTNANFLTLERTAKHYSDLMDVWLRMRELGGFDWIETRYEDVVQDVAAEGRRVTEFLGVPWEAGQAESHEAARKTFLFAPTYSDVTKPVHKKAVGRWEKYAAALRPVQEKLAKYCKAFGYGA